MSPDDKQKHEKLREALKKARTAEDGVVVAHEAIEHLLDHVERLDARLEALDKRTSGIRSGPGGVTHIG